jgi:cyanophycin synthetase
VTAIAAKVAGHFDTYICHRDDNVRGRAPDEMPRLMRAALIELGVPESQITIIEEEQEALAAGLNMAERDDLVLFFCESITRSWKQIINFTPAFGAEEPETDRAARRVQDSSFDIPDGFQVVTDDRGVLIAPAS